MNKFIMQNFARPTSFKMLISRLFWVPLDFHFTETKRILEVYECRLLFGRLRITVDYEQSLFMLAVR